MHVLGFTCARKHTKAHIKNQKSASIGQLFQRRELMIALLKRHREAKALKVAEEQKQREIAVLERIAKIPFPSARIPDQLLEPEKKRSYDEMAESLGFVPAELIRAQLL